MSKGIWKSVYLAAVPPSSAAILHAVPQAPPPCSPGPAALQPASPPGPPRPPPFAPSSKEGQPPPPADLLPRRLPDGAARGGRARRLPRGGGRPLRGGDAPARHAASRDRVGPSLCAPALPPRRRLQRHNRGGGAGERSAPLVAERARRPAALPCLRHLPPRRRRALSLSLSLALPLSPSLSLSLYKYLYASVYASLYYSIFYSLY